MEPQNQKTKNTPNFNVWPPKHKKEELNQTNFFLQK